MPNYDFKCPKCGHRFEQNVPAESKAVFCPRCHDVAKKQPSAPAFHIRGYSAKNGYSR